MVIKFQYTCTCGANGIIRYNEEKLSQGMVLVGDCVQCSNTIVVMLNKIDSDNEIIDCTVQIRKTKKLD